MPDPTTCQSPGCCNPGHHAHSDLTCTAGCLYCNSRRTRLGRKLAKRTAQRDRARAQRAEIADLAVQQTAAVRRGQQHDAAAIERLTGEATEWARLYHHLRQELARYVGDGPATVIPADDVLVSRVGDLRVQVATQPDATLTDVQPQPQPPRRCHTCGRPVQADGTCGTVTA